MEKGNWEYKKIGTLSLCEFNPECPWGFEQKMTYALKRHIIYASSEETMEKSLESGRKNFQKGFWAGWKNGAELTKTMGAAIQKQEDSSKVKQIYDSFFDLQMDLFDEIYADESFVTGFYAGYDQRINLINALVEAEDEWYKL